MTIQQSPKSPGDLCFGERGELFRVNADGLPVPHEQPHRTEARLRAEKRQAQVRANLDGLRTRRSVFFKFK